MARRPEIPWKTEAALCAEFSDLATADGWTVYPALVPWQDSGFADVCRLCGVTAVTIKTKTKYGPRFEDLGREPWIEPALPTTELADPFVSWSRRAWTPHHFVEPCWIPPYVPDLPAGVPAPIQLTHWKVQAVRLCVLLRERGFITTADIRAAKLSPTYFTQNLLVPEGRVGRMFRYVPRPGTRLPDEDHPDIAAKIREEAAVTAAVVAPAPAGVEG